LYYRIINRKKRGFTIIADLLGYALWTPINIFRKSRKRAILSENIKEILVIRTAYIGDVIMTLPILKPLKELYPDARITLLTSSSARDVLLNNPYVDAILTYDDFWFYPKGFKEAVKDYLRFLKTLRSKTYDLIIEARADIRDILLLAYLSKSRYKVSYKVGGGGYLLTHVVPFKEVKHRINYHLDIVKFLGGKIDKIEWGMYLDSKEQNIADLLLSQEGVNCADFLVGIHPGSRKELKAWFPDRFAKLADSIITEYGAQVIFTGSTEEKEFIGRIIVKMDHTAVNLAGKTDLRLLSGIIDKLDLFVCNDSAPLHVASAMKTPTVAIFGPSKSKETGPFGNIHKIVEKNFPCRFSCDEDICKHKVYKECMEKIQVTDVLEAARKIIGELRKKIKYQTI